MTATTDDQPGRRDDEAVPASDADRRRALTRGRRRGSRRTRRTTFGALVALAGTLTVLGTASPAAADPPPLAGVYAGTVTGDFGSSAGVTLAMTGSPSAVTADTTIQNGVRVDCHGNQAVGFRRLPLTGSRTVVNGDGTSAYELRGRFEFDATVHVVVDLVMHGVLSADGSSFGGTVDVLVRPSIGSNCARVFSFATSNHVRIVPDVIDTTWTFARDTMLAQQLNPVRRVQVDYTCNHQGTVWRVHPRAGTFVPVWSTIDVVIGVRDYRRPCP